VHTGFNGLESVVNKALSKCLLQAGWFSPVGSAVKVSRRCGGIWTNEGMRKELKLEPPSEAPQLVQASFHSRQSRTVSARVLFNLARMSPQQEMRSKAEIARSVASETLHIVHG